MTGIQTFGQSKGPYRGKSGVQSAYLLPPTTSGTVTYSTGAGFSTEGGWTQITSSLNIGGDGLITHLVLGYSGANVTYTCEIGVGGSGSEQVLCEIVANNSGSPTTTVHALAFPLFVPNGSRIAVRGTGSSSFSVPVWIQIVNTAALEAY